jgi:Glycosyl transferase family 2
MAPVLLWLIMVVCLVISVVKYVMGIILKISFPSAIKKDYTYQPAVSVLMPCFNEGKTVYETIASIAKCNYPAHKFEVIAQDDCSVDDSYEWMLKARQAQAQRDLLRTPTGLAGFTQPETGLPMQIVGGATLGLSNVRKAGLTVDAAEKECALYKTTTEAQLAIQYALPSIEREALRNRLTLIERAYTSLTQLMDKTSKMVESQNATRLILFELQTTRIKLDADRADTQSKLSAIYVPDLSDRPLKELAAEKESNETGEQRALDKLNRQNNWDVALTVGLHQQLNPALQGPQPYGEVTVNYNFAGRAIDRHLDRAAEAHDNWKKAQEGDVVRSMEMLRQQLTNGVTAQERRLEALQKETAEVDKNLELVAQPDTSAALNFNNQLTATKLLLDIEAGDASFRRERLREYLAKNY